jgi:valyl-tRNA synthetase
MSKNYDHNAIEEKWQKVWQESGIYNWDENDGNVFSIDTPPPTVSGLLHMGHIFSYTQTDFIARYQRMIGKNVFYPMGFDDNGLPTERLVEKVKGIRSINMERSEFVEICREVIPTFEQEFRKLFDSIALSVDWNQEYQTISSHSQKISQMSFLDLYEKGKVIRKKSPVFWDPVDKTAIAQAEIEDKEQNGIMNYIEFKLEDSSASITIATTRPELIPACVCVFVNPDDNRYKYLIGKNVFTPIFNKIVPILSDQDVLIDKGSGAVMCCTFGDIQDVHWVQKHNLEIIQCITQDGKMQQAEFLDGLYVKHAKAAMIEKLKEIELIVKQEPVVQQVKCAERSGAPLEILSTEQWFIKVMDAKDEIIQKSNECNWHPEYMKVRLENWVNGLNQDWCISRQRHFGVPFPVWYSKRSGEEGKILVPSPAQLPVDPDKDLPSGYTRDEVVAERDVMDTWATSAVSPQISSTGISAKYAIDSKKHAKLFPFDLRPQAHEIIRIWAFGTIVKSLYHQNTIPWKNLMISGWCLANDKSKMSKSKGNVVDPVELINERGADVVRYWASTSKLGNDIILSEDPFKIGRKLVLKLINAIEFFKMHLKNLKVEVKEVPLQNQISQNKISEVLDHWIISKLHKTIIAVEKEMEQFEYSVARSAIEDFFWNDLCDNYLELVKERLYKEHENSRGQSGIVTLYYVFDCLLRLFAPFIPYITEELHSSTFNLGSIHSRSSWPKSENWIVQGDVSEGDLIVEILGMIRKSKSEQGLSIGVSILRVEIFLENEKIISESGKADLKATSKASELIFLSHKKKNNNLRIEVLTYL